MAERTEGEAVKALEAAGEALADQADGHNDWSVEARACVAAYLDSLLGDIPEEAVEARAKARYAGNERDGIYGRTGVEWDADDLGMPDLKKAYRAGARKEIESVLRSLRSSLDSA